MGSVFNDNPSKHPKPSCFESRLLSLLHGARLCGSRKLCLFPATTPLFVSSISLPRRSRIIMGPASKWVLLIATVRPFQLCRNVRRHRNDCNRQRIVTYFAYHVTCIRTGGVWPCLFRLAIVLHSTRFPECTAASSQNVYRQNDAVSCISIVYNFSNYSTFLLFFCRTNYRPL